MGRFKKHVRSHPASKWNKSIRLHRHVLNHCAESTLPFNLSLNNHLLCLFLAAPSPKSAPSTCTFHFLPSLLYFQDPNFSKVFTTSVRLGVNIHLAYDFLMRSRWTCPPGGLLGHQQQASIASGSFPLSWWLKKELIFFFLSEPLVKVLPNL